MSRPTKRSKGSNGSNGCNGSKNFTTLDNAEFDKANVTEAKMKAKMNFRCPVTVDNVFGAPTSAQVRMFYESRNYPIHVKKTTFDGLTEAQKLRWEASCADNNTLMGFLVYAQLFPSLLRKRIKLNDASYHWSRLDPASEKGRLKLHQRRQAADKIYNRETFARSVLLGLPYRLNHVDNILKFGNLHIDQEDERYRFFISREFSIICAKRGEVGSSSVYASCSTALGLLWFATNVLARPCCLEAVILPLAVHERRMLENRFHCPPHFFDGPIRGFNTNWRQVFAAIDTHHRNIDYTLLEFATQHKYVEGVHVADAFAAFRATMTAPGDTHKMDQLLHSYRTNSKHGVECGGVVGILDVVRQKPRETIGNIDGGVIGTILSTYGEKACLAAREQCTNLHRAKTLFDDSVSNKLGEILAHFDTLLWEARKKDKTRKVVAANMDPAGMNSKIQQGKMLDPTDPEAVAAMHNMLKSLSKQVWKPLKSLIGKALGASMEYPAAFLQMSPQEHSSLHETLQQSGVVYTDIANLCTLLLLSFSFQRSQVLRESTVDEFVIAPEASHYKFVFKNRRFKSAAAAPTDCAPPVSHFILTPDQSMIVKYIATVGHTVCNLGHHHNRRLFVNAKGQAWTQKDICLRFKRIGLHWLGIENFGAHISRTFWATHALNSGQVGPNNIQDFSSFLQVSSTTLRNSYMAASANTAAHTLGHQVLGEVINSACTGETTSRGSRPYGKKLRTRRMHFATDIHKCLEKHQGDTRTLFRHLLQKRTSSRLTPDEAWFRFENTFFDDKDQRLFDRFVDAIKSSST